MEKFSLDRDWKFYNGDFELPETKTHTECYMAAKAGGAIGAASPDFDKSDWETVTYRMTGRYTMNLKKNGDRRKDTKNAVKRGIQRDFVLMKVTEISKF